MSRYSTYNENRTAAAATGYTDIFVGTDKVLSSISEDGIVKRYATGGIGSYTVLVKQTDDEDCVVTVLQDSIGNIAIEDGNEGQVVVFNTSLNFSTYQNKIYAPFLLGDGAEGTAVIPVLGEGGDVKGYMSLVFYDNSGLLSFDFRFYNSTLTSAVTLSSLVGNGINVPMPKIEIY